MPIITISRGTLSGGKMLADCLADHLGYQCISREVIIDAAAEYEISLDRLIEVMEKPPSFWEHLTGERAKYLNYIRIALCERAKSGNLVYHGHAGHLLLADIRHVIRVRVIADMESRIRGAMAMYNVDRKGAIAHIEKADWERVRWTKFLYDVNWYDPSLYDIVLNLEHITLDGACDILADLAQMERFQPTPESLKAVEDLSLGCRVWAKLANDPRTRAAEVKVVADGGVVTVSGRARSEDILEAIPLVAREVDGVTEVQAKTELGSIYG
ncbi:MAG: cytidylate kinase family protein [Dehalococcoidales bacterium]|nr:cytidylate kinase family protein [Dehalococcoidales bacterium]